MLPKSGWDNSRVIFGRWIYFIFREPILNIKDVRSILRLFLPRLTAANRTLSHTKMPFWNQGLNGFPVTYGVKFMLMRPEMARRIIVYMGTFCDFDFFGVKFEVNIGKIQNVTVGRQIGQIG